MKWALVVRAFRRRRGNSLLGRKIPCIFPARRKKYPARPAQGILPQGTQIQGLFGTDFPERGRIPCCLPAQQGIFPACDPLPRLQQALRLRQLDDKIRLVLTSSNRLAFSYPRKRVSRLARFAAVAWLPAFAGMTGQCPFTVTEADHQALRAHPPRRSRTEIGSVRTRARRTFDWTTASPPALPSRFACSRPKKLLRFRGFAVARPFCLASRRSWPKFPHSIDSTASSSRSARRCSSIPRAGR